MQYLHSSVNCLHIQFAQTVQQRFSNGGTVYDRWYAEKFRKNFFEYLKFIYTKRTTKTVLNIISSNQFMHILLKTH